MKGWRGSSGFWIFLAAVLVLGGAIYAGLQGRRGADAALKRMTEEAAVPTVAGSSRVDLQACKLEYSIVSPK